MLVVLLSAAMPAVPALYRCVVLAASAPAGDLCCCWWWCYGGAGMTGGLLLFECPDPSSTRHLRSSTIDSFLSFVLSICVSVCKRIDIFDSNS